MKLALCMIISLYGITGFTETADTLAVYNYYCESSNPHEIDTTIFSYQSDTLHIRNVRNEFCCPQILKASVIEKNDTLKVHVFNPSEADCTCECSFGYSVKIRMTPFDTLHVTINDEKFTLNLSDLKSSVDNLSDNDCLIYPNPVSNILYINGIQPKRIEMTDINGKITRLQLKDTQSIDVNNLKTGTYVLTILTDTGTWTEKIVKE